MIHRKRDIGGDKVVVDVKSRLAQIVIQDFTRQFSRENTLIAKLGKGNYIDVSGWPQLLCLYILAEAAVHPLKSMIDTSLLKTDSELKPAKQYDLSLSSVAKSLAEGQSIRAIGRAIS